MDSELRLAFARAGGLLRRRDNPELARRCDRQLAAGTVSSPLPGILAAGELLDTEARIAAGALWAGPDAVVCGLAAARLTFWPDATVPVVELASTARGKSRPGWVVARRAIPEELVIERDGRRITCPALTAVDLAAGPLGGDAIDRVLRTRTGTLEQMWRAFELTPGRRGNQVRAMLLDDSRDLPWSEAERRLHRIFRAAGITGWHTNVPVGPFLVDVCFDDVRLVIEVDGYAVHGNRSAFEADRFRRNEIILAAGYLVLNFTWAQITERPDWVIDCVRRALALLG